MMAYIHAEDSFAEKSVEQTYLLAVTSHFSVVLLFVDLEAEPVLLQGLSGGFAWQLLKGLCYFASLSRKNPELFRFNDEVELGALIDKTIKQ